jgi:hypothetical protein
MIEMNESNSTWRISLSELAFRSGSYRLKCMDLRRNSIKRAIAQSIARTGSHPPGRLRETVCCLSLWFSLPLAIWLSSGWIGLLAHWQAISATVCIFQESAPEPATEFPGNPCLDRSA